MSKTTKSFKVQNRDKIGHSASGLGAAKKGGGGGKGTWGRAGDEFKYRNDYYAMDKNDPNYDPMENEPTKVPGENKVYWSPPPKVASKFAASIEDLARFKQQVISAIDEYLQSHDFAELKRIIVDINQPMYHQDLPYVLIKQSFEKNDDARLKVCTVLKRLHGEDIISSTQMVQGFRKVSNQLDDMLLDTPNARVYFKEYINHGVVSGYLDPICGSSLEPEDMSASSDSDGNNNNNNSNPINKLAETKQRIDAFVAEYFESGDVGDVCESLKTDMSPAYGYEVIKRVISMSLDRNDEAREKASVLMAAVSGDQIPQDQVVKAFTIMLERVEDLYLDVPKVMKLLSCLLARAVVDEALPPAFLGRVDLADGDMGRQVVTRAQELLKVERAAEKLDSVWVRKSSMV